MNEAVFKEKYALLNSAQKEAVDTVEGPVLVVAGPGTGKTHILTLRIANILAHTQARPSNILALTFTDSAARTMRVRLGEIVGAVTASEVMITTFHGFAEYVISEKPEYFESFSQRRPMSDVEQRLLCMQVFDELETSVLRPPKAPYHYLSDVLQIYDALTRERVSYEAYEAWAKEQIDAVAHDPKHQYVRGEKKGEMKASGVSEIARYEKCFEVIKILKAYDAKKEARGVYDFGDMLRVLIETLKEEEGLRSDLQEQFQYILADEHQDANAFQHSLLELLAYDDHPNLFVVGDEKQAIYAFQGGDVSGFRSFNTLFPRARTVTLSESFRSLQDILDSAHEVIEDTGDHERLSSFRSEGKASLSLHAYGDPLLERSGVALRIQKLIEAGVPPHEIAVIARKNETANLFADTLRAYGIETLRGGEVSFLSRPVLRSFFALLRYMGDATNMHELRTALLAPWWSVDQKDLLVLLQKTYDSNLLDVLEKEQPELSKLLSGIRSEVETKTPPEALSYILKESGAHAYFLSNEEGITDMYLLRALMLYVEDFARIEEGVYFHEVMKRIGEIHDRGMSSVKRSITQREGAVSVLTAHKAKGMEFSHVFVACTTKREWESGGKKSSLRSPLEGEDVLLSAKRLFYVALTRAKDTITMTYAREDAEGREQIPSSLVAFSKEVVHEEEDMLPELHRTIVPSDLLVSMSTSYICESGLSPSALEDYLTAPPQFFARRVLHMYQPPEGAIVLGNAVHRGIASVLRGGSEAEGREKLRQTFYTSLLKQDSVFRDLLLHAEKSFEVCMREKESLGTVRHIEETFTTKESIEGKEVILKGKVDAVFETEDGLLVCDFKTGSQVSKNDEHILRQLYLYAYILQKNEKDIRSVRIAHVTPEKLALHDIPLEDARMESTLTELHTAVKEILSGSWRVGESSEYDVLLELLKS